MKIEQNYTQDVFIAWTVAVNNTCSTIAHGYLRMGICMTGPAEWTLYVYIIHVQKHERGIEHIRRQKWANTDGSRLGECSCCMLVGSFSLKKILQKIKVQAASLCRCHVWHMRSRCRLDFLILINTSIPEPLVTPRSRAACQLLWQLQVHVALMIQDELILKLASYWVSCQSTRFHLLVTL